MKKLTFPQCASKKALQLILNSNKLKHEVKILYPNMVIVDLNDLSVIEKILERNYINCY
jgi:hypothetical protein